MVKRSEGRERGECRYESRQVVGKLSGGRSAGKWRGEVPSLSVVYKAEGAKTTCKTR